MDIGECSRIHDLGLRADYELAQKSKVSFFNMESRKEDIFYLNECVTLQDLFWSYLKTLTCM